ncbi:MAG: hypothetical protein KDA63_17650 [Planctomycetales bacterium]|nr:hypothetical protein [Planctomycetales bacterium]
MPVTAVRSISLADVPSSLGAALLIAALSVAAAALRLMLVRHRLAGTTLGPALWWSVAALLAVAAQYLFTALGEVAVTSSAVADATGALTRWDGQRGFALATLSLCPALAALGAKRPQHHVWQWIVLSFWVIVNLPNAQSLLLGAGHLELHGLWRWFLAVLVATGWLNWCGTRWWLPGTLVVLAQCCWLGPHLPGTPLVGWESHWAIGGPLAAVGTLAISLGWPRAKLRPAGIDRVMADFRDMFGNLWALRIAERFNLDARAHDWPVTFTPGGAVPGDSAPNGAHSEGDDPSHNGSATINLDEAPRRLLKSLLGRFVSEEWFETRWPATR